MAVVVGTAACRRVGLDWCGGNSNGGFQGDGSIVSVRCGNGHGSVSIPIRVCGSRDGLDIDSCDSPLGGVRCARNQNCQPKNLGGSYGDDGSDPLPVFWAMGWKSNAGKSAK